MNFAFYSFKQAPLTIGGETYGKLTGAGPRILVGSSANPGTAVRNLGNSKNCLGINGTSAVKAVPVSGCVSSDGQHRYKAEIHIK